MDNARREIFEKLRKGREQAPFSTPYTPLARTSARPSRDPDADWERVARSLEPLNGRLLLANDVSEAEAYLRDILAETQARSVVRWEHPLLEELGVDAWLERAGVVSPALSDAPFCQRIAGVDVGLTAVDAVFAVAGTLVLMAAPGRPRGVSLVPPVHVALAPQSLLYDDLASLPGLLRQRLDSVEGAGRLPSAVQLITGSSSTADIEQTLVRPAHGPALVRVVGLRWL